jgi:hypothetical protein
MKRSSLSSFLLVLAGTLTGFSVTTKAQAQLGPGSIVITGVVTNGNSQFSFVPTTNISAGTTIYFSNWNWDNTANSNAGGFDNNNPGATGTSNWPGTGTSGTLETWNSVNTTTIAGGIIGYLVPPSTGLSAGTQVIISQNTANTNLQGGSLVANSGGANTKGLTLNHNGAGQPIYAFITSQTTAVSRTTVTSSNATFLSAVLFGPDTWQTTGPILPNHFWDSVLPPGLTSTTSTDLSTLWASGFGSNFLTTQNVSAFVNCQSDSSVASLTNPVFWSGNGNLSSSNFALFPVATGVAACSANTGGFSLALSPTATEIYNTEAEGTATAIIASSYTPTTPPTNTQTPTNSNTPVNT